MQKSDLDIIERRVEQGHSDVLALIAEIERLNKKLEKLLETNIHLERELDKALGNL